MRKTVTYRAKNKMGVERKRYSKVWLSLKELEEDEFVYRTQGKYVHFRRGKGWGVRNFDTERLVKPWTVQSQLDTTLKDILENTGKLKDELGKGKSSGIHQRITQNA